MSKLAPVVGSIIYLAEEGETVETVTVADTAAGKPAGSDFSTWRELGCVESYKIDPGLDGGEKIRCYDTTVGAYKTKASRGERVDPVIDAVVQDCDDLLIALAHGAAGVDGSDNFAPGTGNGKVRGWIKVQNYIGTVVNVILEAWVEISVPDGVTFEEAATKLNVRIELQTPTSGTVQGTLADQFAAA